MPRTQKRQLQWHKASKRWCKRYTDPQTGKKPCVYLGLGTPTRDGKGRQDELYDRALTKWLKIKEELDAKEAARIRDEEIDLPPETQSKDCGIFPKILKTHLDPTLLKPLTASHACPPTPSPKTP